MQKIRAYSWYIVFFILILAFLWITDFNGLYGQDSYEYLRYTKCLLQFFKNGSNPGAFFWPLIYPIVGALLSFILKPLFALQLISIITFIGAAVYLKRTIILLYRPCEERARSFLLLFFLLSPYMLRASIVVMSDMLSVFFLTTAFYYFFQYINQKGSKQFIAFVCLATAAVFTRYGAFVLLALPLIIACVTFFKHFKIRPLIITILIASIIVLPHIILRWNQPMAFLNHDWLQDWSVLNFFRRSFNTANGSAAYTTPNIVYAFFNLFHPAFCFIGMVLLIAFVRTYRVNRDRKILIIVLCVVLYALFLAGIPLQNLRFLLLSFPLVALLFFPAFKYLIDLLETRKWKVWAIYVGIAIIQLALFYRVFKPFYSDNRIEKQIAIEVLKHPGPPVYAFSIDGALQAYGVTNRIINLYNTELDTLRPIAGDKLFLFNETQFAEVWKDKSPMNNWNYIKAHFSPIKLEELPDGWVLYKAQ